MEAVSGTEKKKSLNKKNIIRDHIKSHTETEAFNISPGIETF